MDAVFWRVHLRFLYVYKTWLALCLTGSLSCGVLRAVFFPASVYVYV